MKPDLPLGQLPILKVDGETYVQSVAIMRYAAARAGLPALNPVQELRSNMLVDTLNEVFKKTVLPAFAAANAGAPEDKVKNFYGSIQGGAEEAAKKIEKMLTVLKIDDATNADLVSLADFFVLNAYVFFNDKKVNCAKVFEEFAPTAMRMVNRLRKVVKDADKIDAAVNEAMTGQFTPF
jgi:glutathione S-transferase